MLTTFKDIFGQDDAIETIRAAYLADRLPHGLIFAGPVGVGKATTAAALGALFLCENPKNAVPCRKCESCRLFETNSHPDFHVIVKEMVRDVGKSKTAKASEMSIDVIRYELLDKAALTPTMNRGKVFVIEQAELMNTAAQNAMLKTLEEPSGRTLIIMLTDQAGVLLSTIRSRAQIVRFLPLDNRTVREQLLSRGFDKQQAERAMTLSNGSLGLAIRWIEDGVIDFADSLTKQITALERGDGGAGAGGAGAGSLGPFLKQAANAYAEKQLERDELASKDQLLRDGIALYLQFAAEQLRHRIAQAPDDADLAERCCRAIDAIIETERNLDANVAVALLLQQASLAMQRAFDPAVMIWRS